MSNFKVGDRVQVLPGVATPFIGLQGVIQEVQPNDRGIETMEKHIVMFDRREKRAFFGTELTPVHKSK